MTATETLARHKLIQRLLQLPEEIAEQESCLLSAMNALHRNTLTREAVENHLLAAAESPIDGKNAEQRSTQLRIATARERAAVASCEREVLIQRCALKRLENEFRALRSIAALLATEERE